MGASGGWLGGGERARRNVVYAEMPPWLRQRFWREVQLRRRDLGERKAREVAWQVVARIDAWRRRGADAKPCESCGTDVLWRREGGRRPVPVMPDGSVHSCERRPRAPKPKAGT